MERTQLGNRMVETRCIYCGAAIGQKTGGCPDGERHCHWCRTPESRAADPCLPTMPEHSWRRGHEFQRVPIG